jgi:hypothetical protein
MIRYRSIICRDELVGAEASPDPRFGSARHAHVEPDVAVPVAILDEVPEPNLHIAHLYAVISSHGFTAASLLGSAVNASSSCNLSHIVRELMRLGTGIRPSLTSASNSDGEMPT